MKMKRSMLVGLLVVSLPFLAAAPAAAADEPAAPAEVPALDGVPLEEAVCLAPEAGGTPEALEMGWDCPFNAPFCTEDDDCDDYCGDPRFGACVFPGCCSCYG